MPLGFDLPFEKLSSYEGKNPRPPDFDEFWEEGLEEMRAIDPQIEKVEATFQAPYAKCEHLYFTGVDGSRVHAKFLQPREPLRQPGPALVAFHGYSGDSGNWTNYLPFAAAGFTVAAMDCRGQAGLSEDRGGVSGNTLRGHIIRGLSSGSPRDLLFRRIFLDAAQLAGLILELPEVDPSRVGATGGSQGGGLTLACAALEPRIARAAADYPFLCDYQRVWEMDQAKGAYEELATYFRTFDPLHRKEKEIFERLGYIDVQHLAPRIRGEVLMAVGLMDTICPPSTQFAAYNKISAPKSLKIYPDFGHEALRGHSDIVFDFMLGL